MTYLKEIKDGVAEVLTDPIGFATTILFSIGIFALLLLIPVVTTPGNDLFFQISILTPDVAAILIILSLANGLVLAMQYYIHRKVTHEKGRSGKKATIGSVIVSMFSSTVACAACYSAVLAVLGVGTTAVLVKYRVPIAIGALLITLYAIYHASKRINNNCEVCVITPPSKKAA